MDNLLKETLVATNEVGNKFYKTSMTDSLNNYLKRYGLTNYKCLVIELQDGSRDYVIFDKDEKEYVYADTNVESVTCWIDMLGVASGKSLLGADKALLKRNN